MSQLLILAAVGAGAYFGAKWISKKARKFTENIERAHKKAKDMARRQTQSDEKRANVSRKNVQELKKDPKTGVYRLEDE